MDPSLWELYEAGDEADEVAAIVRLSQPNQIPKGARIVAQFGDIATCRIKRGALPDVRADAEVASLKAPRLLVAEDDDEADPGMPLAEFAETYEFSDERRPPNLVYTGNNIVLGVVDWGFDFAHPEFRHEDGTTRLLALWDQRGQSGTSDNPYGYGVIHPPEAINRALKTDDPYRALDYHPADADSGNGAHGTHVLSIAAGNGRGGGPLGIAPQARLVCVNMASIVQQNSNKLGDSVTLLEAVHFINNIAEQFAQSDLSTAANRQSGWVINLSMGRHAQQHAAQLCSNRAWTRRCALAQIERLCKARAIIFQSTFTPAVNFVRPNGVV